MPRSDFILFLETSMTRSEALDPRPSSSVRPLSAICNSSRLWREDRPAICVRRLDWTERILRLERAERFYNNKRRKSRVSFGHYLQLCNFILGKP